MSDKGKVKTTSDSGDSGLVIDRELKAKAPILRIFLLVILVALPIVAVTDLLGKDYVSAAGEVAIFLLVLASFFLLRSGRYKAASRLAAAVFFAGMNYLGYGHEFEGIVGVYRLMVYLSAALGFASFFLVDRRAPIVLAALNAADAILYIAIGYAGKLQAGQLANEIVVASVFSGLIGVLLILPTRMGRGISGDLERERKAEGERAVALRAAAARSEATMGAIGDLSSSVADIRAVSASVLESVSRIEGGLSELDGSADAATSEASSIGDRVSDLNSHIEAEVSAQEESAASVHQMVASVGTVAESVRSRREGLQSLRGTAEEGERRLALLIEAVARINGSVGAILDMIAVINKIASSTNLLAMNASIEAAHAGEAGKGFAVVAEEIRNLAEGSSRNAKEIGAKLKEVVAAITQASEGGARAGESFEGIKREIDRAVGSFDEIASATEELSEGGRQILESIASLNASSQGLKDGGGAIAEAQGALIELQSRAKEGVSRVLSETKAVASRALELREAAEEVSRVAERGSREAAELHEGMLRIGAAS